MKNKYVIKGMFKNKFVYFIGLNNEVLWEGEEFQVRSCSETIDCATKYNSYEEALDIIKEYELHGFEVYPVCPLCNQDYIEPTAISRKDNKTKICSTCGTKEALEIFIKNKTTF